MKSKKEEFKKLFYSNLTEAEIKKLLNINYKEYRELLLDVKKELGLPSNYRRQPKRYWKYTDDSYYILKRDNDNFEILCYCPTKDIAEIKLNNMDLDEGYSYEIEQANDENLIKLIYEEYYIKHNNWEGIINKCKLPYHKFYGLLSIIKNELGNESKSNLRDNRFVYKYPPTKKFVVKKYMNGKYVNFGYYDNEDTAIYVRNYLESINWNFSLWKDNKSRIVGETSNE